MSCLSKSGAKEKDVLHQSFQILMDENFHAIQFQANFEEFEQNFMAENAEYILDKCNREGEKQPCEIPYIDPDHGYGEFHVTSIKDSHGKTIYYDVIGTHLMENQRNMKEINDVMVSDFNLYYLVVFVGYLVLYLALFGILARTVQTRIVTPVTDLTKELQDLKKNSYKRAAANKLVSSSGAVQSASASAAVHSALEGLTKIGGSRSTGMALNQDSTVIEIK
jgi:hypothetical protein